MERILLLNSNQFPAGFDNVSVVPPVGMTKIGHVEDKIICAVNKYNPKLNLSRIEYTAIETQFADYKKGNSNGVIIEEFDINSQLINTYVGNGCYVYYAGNRCLCRRLLMYVFISGTEENTRTAFVSQTVFPTLLEYAEEYLDSPSYSIAAHKFCFINILNKKITSTMILRHLSLLCAAGMDYVEIFDHDSVKTRQIPRDLKEFMRTYSKDFKVKYDAVTDTYEGDNYKIEFGTKKLIWKTSIMISKLIVKASSYVDFHGSEEKFYWIETLPLSIYAHQLGYKVNFDEYKEFIKTYKSKFSPSSVKFLRCEVLLKYIEKYCI